MLRSPPSPSPALRVVLLGASNLKIGFPEILARLRGGAGGPVEVLAALGHGRSYGSWSQVLGVRRLPGILGCGLWEAWEALERQSSKPAPTLALVADAGNDLLYGAPPDRIAEWVSTCLDRLAARGAGLILSLLPLASLETVSETRYRIVRSLLYPGRKAVPWTAMLASARELNDRLRRLGTDRGARVIEPPSSWYGIDPIHIRRRQRSEAWSQILAGPQLPNEGRRPGRTRLPLFGSEELRLCGVALHKAQPVRRFKDGTTVALY